MVRLVHRQQGLMVAPGNPLGLGGIEDLTRPGVRYVNRQRGAGTRVLLDHELTRRGHRPGATSRATPGRSPPTWRWPPPSPSGRADAGMGIMAAARAFGLDFVPVAEEPYDLVTTAATLEAGVLDPLLDLIGDAGFVASVEALGGYSTAETGRRIR